MSRLIFQTAFARKPNKQRFFCGVAYAVSAGFAVFALGAHAQESVCDEQGSEHAAIVCGHADFLLADAKLNDAYRSALNLLGNDGKFSHAKNELIASQRAWVKFRDADCRVQNELFEGGSKHDAITDQCLTDLTDERTEELQQIWLP